jgi:hypothetical protein
VRGLGCTWLDLRGLSYLQFPVRREPEPSDCALIYRSSPRALVELDTAFGLIAGSWSCPPWLLVWWSAPLCRFRCRSQEVVP